MDAVVDAEVTAVVSRMVTSSLRRHRLTEMKQRVAVVVVVALVTPVRLRWPRTKPCTTERRAMLWSTMRHFV